MLVSSSRRWNLHLYLDRPVLKPPFSSIPHQPRISWDVPAEVNRYAAVTVTHPTSTAALQLVSPSGVLTKIVPSLDLNTSRSGLVSVVSSVSGSNSSSSAR